jgi:glucose-1-phosphate adenylyltransferase
MNLAGPIRQRPPHPESLALVLAGGSGTRLAGLTAWRAKPAVPFGGHFRTIDFTLSNCINSGIRQIALLTQYKSQSLIRHVQGGWGFLHRELNEFVDIWPAQQRQGERWYTGTVDAVHQNLDLIQAIDPEYVLVLGGAQIYSMDYAALLDEHISHRADLTVGCVEVPLKDAGEYGVVTLDQGSRVHGFVERPIASVRAPEDCDSSRALMGVYVFDAAYLFDCLARDASDPGSLHDFAYDLLPAAIAEGRVFGYDFRSGATDCPGYWRDVSTVDSYWQAHMDLLEDPPRFDLFDPNWPIATHQMPAGPMRVQASVRMNALIGPGCGIRGEICRSVISTNCCVGEHSRVTNSVLLPNVHVGSGCSLDRVIIDSHCAIPDNTVIGGNSPIELDHFLSAQGIVLITRPNGGSRGTSIASRKVA